MPVLPPFSKQEDNGASKLSHEEILERQRFDWLRLYRTENIGPATFRKLINRFGSAANALEALPYLAQNTRNKTLLKPPTKSEIEDEIAKVKQMGSRFICAFDEQYPPLLKYIHSSPPILTILGGENINYTKTIAIVGGRNASAAGRRIVSLIASELSEMGYIIISGLARGIDSVSHQASLKKGTVAILAGGIDYIYPIENVDLAAKIVENGGALISEMPLGHEPRAKDFPRRNRIISGISQAVLVVEAAKRSGSLITAKFALEHDREIFAVPGSPLDSRSTGANHLIKQGAILVSSAKDIVEQLENNPLNNKRLFEEDENYFFTQCGAELVTNLPDKDMSKSKIELAGEKEKNIVLKALSPTPIAVDELIQQTKFSADLVQIILLELDIEGRIEWASGQLVSLK